MHIRIHIYTCIQDDYEDGGSGSRSATDSDANANANANSGTANAEQMAREEMMQLLMRTLGVDLTRNNQARMCLMFV